MATLGTPSRTKSSVFFNIVQTAFDPPPSFLNIYVADFSKGLLKKCVKACRDKCVKIVRKSLRKNVQSTKKLWQFYLQYVTILPPEDLFYVNSYCQIASRIIPNLQQNFWTWVWPPPPVWTMFKKTDDLVRKGVPYISPKLATNVLLPSRKRQSGSDQEIEINHRKHETEASDGVCEINWKIG